MTELLDLVNREVDDEELIPDILPVEARLSISGEVSNFYELFEKAVAIAPLKPTIPNTEFVLLEAFDATALQSGYVQVTATDGVRSIAAVNDELTIQMTGSVLLPGRKVAEILKLVPKSEVRLTVLGGTATIRSGRAVWTIQTPSDDTLPPLPDVSDIELHTVEVGPFLQALQVARFAASTTTARMSLMQVKVAENAFWGCDGARVHKMSVEDAPGDYTMQVKFVDDVIRSLMHFDDEYFEMGHNHATVVFRLGRDLLMGQQLLLEYPDIPRLALEPALLNSESLFIRTSNLRGAVNRVRVAADPDEPAIHLILRPIKNGKEVRWTLTVKARDKASNTSQETFGVDYEGGVKAKVITVNHRHLIDLLNGLRDENVVFKLGEGRSPLYVDDGKFVGLVNQMASSLK
jgi:DNA polymerase III sliding clamp (beta) subunit (PCNA family)